MRTIGLLLAANLISLALLGIAVYMMHEHIKGWGWVITAAVLMGHYISNDKDDK